MNIVALNYQGVPVVVSAGNENKDACKFVPAKSRKACVHYHCKAVQDHMQAHVAGMCIAL